MNGHHQLSVVSIFATSSLTFPDVSKRDQPILSNFRECFWEDTKHTTATHPVSKAGGSRRQPPHSVGTQGDLSHTIKLPQQPTVFQKT